MSSDHKTCLVITRHVSWSQDMSLDQKTCLVITVHILRSQDMSCDHKTCFVIKRYVLWSQYIFKRLRLCRRPYPLTWTTAWIDFAQLDVLNMQAEHALSGIERRHSSTLVCSRVRVFVCFRSQRVSVCELHLASDDFLSLIPYYRRFLITVDATFKKHTCAFESA